jgi:hypothetical protein
MDQGFSLGRCPHCHRLSYIQESKSASILIISIALQIAHESSKSQSHCDYRLCVDDVCSARTADPSLSHCSSPGSIGVIRTGDGRYLGLAGTRNDDCPRYDRRNVEPAPVTGDSTRGWTFFGRPLVSYTLTPWEAFKQGQNGRGGVQFDDRELLDQLQRGTISDRLLNQYATIWMAGIAAETLLYGTAEGGDDDRQQLRSILSQLRPAIADISARERWAFLQAQTFLQAHPETYKQLVKAMEQRLSVTECTQKIVQSMPPATSH